MKTNEGVAPLRRAVTALCAMLAVVVLPSCGEPKPGDPDELPPSEELAIERAPTLLSFDHVVGRSPCPQSVGRITVRNRGTSPFTVRPQPRGTLPLTFSPASRLLRPGETIEVEVAFTCASQTSFIATIDLLDSAAQSQTSPDSSIVVRGTITR